MNIAAIAGPTTKPLMPITAERQVERHHQAGDEFERVLTDVEQASGSEGFGRASDGGDGPSVVSGMGPV